MADIGAIARRCGWLEDQEFYELMQTYRHAQEWTKPTVVEAFEAVKAYILERNCERDL